MFQPPARSHRPSLVRIREKYTCVFGCPPQGLPTRRFPHPAKYAAKFADWIETICDSVKPDDPLITQLINLDPQQIYMTKCICEAHFHNKDAQSNHKTFNKPVLMRMVLKRSNVMQRLEMEQNNVPEVNMDHDYAQRINVLPTGSKDVGNVKVESWNAGDVSMYDGFNDIRESTNKRYIGHKTDCQWYGERNIDAMHEHVTCNICAVQIIGFRYACVQCADFDLCATCEGRGEHSSHYMLRVPGPRSYANVKSMLDIIRRELISCNYGRPLDNSTDTLKKVKVEPEDEETAQSQVVVDIQVPPISPYDLSHDEVEVQTLPTSNQINETAVSTLVQNNFLPDTVGHTVDTPFVKRIKTKRKTPNIPQPPDRLWTKTDNGSSTVPNSGNLLVQPTLIKTMVSCTTGKTTVFIVRKPSMLNKVLAKRSRVIDPLSYANVKAVKLKEVKVVLHRLTSTEIENAMNSEHDVT